jgi:hypothetical protein
LAEYYLLYASITLFALGCLALALSVLFRLKSRVLNSLPKDLSANVFNKTFSVFDPYSSHRILHRFLSLIPFIAGLLSFCFAVFILIIIQSGLLLVFFILLVATDLILVEESPEAYQNAKVIINAVRRGADLGTGDVRLFNVTKKASVRLANYYLVLTVLLVTVAVILPYAWSFMLWSLEVLIDFVFQASSVAGVVAWIAAVFLYAVVIFAIQISIFKAKGRLLRIKF